MYSASIIFPPDYALYYMLLSYAPPQLFKLVQFEQTGTENIIFVMFSVGVLPGFLFFLLFCEHSSCSYNGGPSNLVIWN